jgi:hypothetical protein
VGSTGLIEFAPENVYPRSQEFNDGTWTKTNSSITANATTAPDGTLTADKLVEDATASITHALQNPALFPNGGRQTLSIFAKKGGRNFIVLRSFADDYYFNLNTGVAITAGGTITDQGNGWYRCSVTTNTGTQSQIKMSADGVTAIYTGDGTSGIFIWGIQLEQHSSARAYIPTTTAAVFGARFDHDPLTLVCKGLLIEESRTNLATYSENFTDSSWATFTSVSAANVTSTNPSGATTTTRLTANAGTQSKRVRNKFLTIPSGSYVATSSCFVKAGTSGFGHVTMLFNKDGVGIIRECAAHIVFSTGVITKTGTLNANFTVTSTAYPDGWYRIAISATSNASTSVEDQVILAVGVSFDGVGGSGTFAGTETVFAWGAQIEVGSFPTSYIPTTTGTLARSADVCSITGGDFNNFYNQSEGAFLLKATSLMATATGGNRTFVSFTDGGYINQQALYKTVNGTNLNFAIGSGVGPTIGTLTAGSPFAVSGAMQVANNAAAFNGAAAVAVTGSATTGISKLEFRDPTGAAAGHPTMHISQFRYYKKRLPNAKLQALTV